MNPYFLKHSAYSGCMLCMVHRGSSLKPLRNPLRIAGKAKPTNGALLTACDLSLAPIWHLPPADPVFRAEPQLCMCHSLTCYFWSHECTRTCGVPFASTVFLHKTLDDLICNIYFMSHPLWVTPQFSYPEINIYIHYTLDGKHIHIVTHTAHPATCSWIHTLTWRWQSSLCYHFKFLWYNIHITVPFWGHFKWIHIITEEMLSGIILKILMNEFIGTEHP